VVPWKESVEERREKNISLKSRKERLLAPVTCKKHGRVTSIKIEKSIPKSISPFREKKRVTSPTNLIPQKKKGAAQKIKKRLEGGPLTPRSKQMAKITQIQKPFLHKKGSAANTAVRTAKETSQPNAPIKKKRRLSLKK